MVISVILSKTSIRDKTHEFKCVRIQDYEGGDYSPEHYYMKEELKSFIFNTPHRRMCVQHPETVYKIASSLLSSKYGPQYIESKKKLFSMLSTNSIAVLNKDEEVFEEFKDSTKARIMTYGIKNESEIMAKNIELYIDHSEFDLLLKGNKYHINCPVIADFNIYNVLATVGALVGLGFDDRMIIEAIGELEPVDGRMEIIPNRHNITIIVDYCCHTKDFENVFKFADRVSRGRIIAVLGAPSKRHIARRKKIGELANRYLDHVILTELDDRGEKVEDICEEIQEAITDIPSIIITNRAIAVEQAVEQASPGDVILLLGKGHEKFISLEVGQRDYEGDKAIALKAIKRVYEGEEENELQ